MKIEFQTTEGDTVNLDVIKAKRYCACMSVGGALEWSRSEAEYNCKWIRINGKQPTVDELRRHLADLLAKGVEFIPYKKCDNWDDRVGCRGHEL